MLAASSLTKTHRTSECLNATFLGAGDLDEDSSTVGEERFFRDDQE